MNVNKSTTVLLSKFINKETQNNKSPISQNIHLRPKDRINKE